MGEGDGAGRARRRSVVDEGRGAGVGRTCEARGGLPALAEGPPARSPAVATGRPSRPQFTGFIWIEPLAAASKRSGRGTCRRSAGGRSVGAGRRGGGSARGRSGRRPLAGPRGPSEPAVDEAPDDPLPCRPRGLRRPLSGRGPWRAPPRERPNLWADPNAPLLCRCLGRTPPCPCRPPCAPCMQTAPGLYDLLPCADDGGPRASPLFERASLPLRDRRAPGLSSSSSTGSSRTCPRNEYPSPTLMDRRRNPFQFPVSSTPPQRRYVHPQAGNVDPTPQKSAPRQGRGLGSKSFLEHSHPNLSAPDPTRGTSRTPSPAGGPHEDSTR